MSFNVFNLDLTASGGEDLVGTFVNTVTGQSADVSFPRAD
jgi:hypothetical protein